MAAAKEFNVVVVIAAVLSELDSIFTLREKPENRTFPVGYIVGELDWSTGRCIITVQVLPPPFQTFSTVSSLDGYVK